MNQGRPQTRIGSEQLVRFDNRLIRSGVSMDEALQRTQGEAIRAGRHPVRWAAFQLYGDWR